MIHDRVVAVAPEVKLCACHEQVRQLLAGMGEGRQTLLFSATLPGALADFARVGLKDPALVRLDTETRISPDLRLAFFTLRLPLIHSLVPPLHVLPLSEQAGIMKATSSSISSSQLMHVLFAPVSYSARTSRFSQSSSINWTLRCA